MKIQCACGAKYAFDITPEMARTPIRFVCQTCGLDSSDLVNELIRQELGQASPVVARPAPQGIAIPQGIPIPQVVPVPPGAPVKPAAPSAPVRVATPPPPTMTAPVRVHTGNASPASAAPAETQSATQFCPKHPGEETTHRCRICQKPMCAKCMEVFGYVCSPLCKAKAASHGIAIPEYEGQKSVVEARHWRKVGRLATAVAAVIVLLLGVWTWYVWLGSRPKAVFSVRFSEPAYSGQSKLVGKDQIVFLHGATLARYNWKKEKQIWSRDLIDQKQIEADAVKAMKDLETDQKRDALQGLSDRSTRMPTMDELKSDLAKQAAAEMQLHIQGQNVWVSSRNKFVRYDWATGNPAKEIPFANRSGALVSRGNELLEIGGGQQRQVVTHIDLASGEVRTENFGEGADATPAVAASSQSPRVGGAGSRGQELAGLPVGTPGRDAGKALDPSRVAAEAQRLPLPAKLALPAVLSSQMTQERLLAEIADQEGRKKQAELGFPEQSSLMPTKDGFVQFSVWLVERNLVARKAMKAPPKKSVLDGAVNVANSADASNEILNEMQRSRGGDTVMEDESRYRVTIRRPDTKDVADWTGEVIGPPSLFPLETVTVLAAGKTIHVFDKKNQKIWQTQLNYTVPEGPFSGDANTSFGAGPCVERAGILYVADEGVLTAFDAATGSVRWRLPSVGIAGIYFDDEGMIYLNTTTAGPESLKFSRQVDITKKNSDVVRKIDSQTGKTLWSVEPGGFITYATGRFIYVVQSYRPPEDDMDSAFKSDSGFEHPPYLRVRRLDPKNGHVMWEHFQQRAPLDIEFDQNSIQLVFKKEVQVLKFFSF